MSYYLGKKSLKELTGVRPELVAVVKEAIKITKIDFAVFDGIRSIEQQKEYVRIKASKTMNSKHLPQPDGYGYAVDLVPWIGGKLRFQNWEPFFEIALAMDKAATKLKVTLIWGGVWDRTMMEYGGSAASMKAAVDDYCRRHPGPDFIDGPHYQFVK